MAELEDKDPRYVYLKDKIQAAFPKLAGKLDKIFSADETKEVVISFLDDDSVRCLAVPENMKIEKVIPTKLAKGNVKVVLFIKLKTCKFSSPDNMKTDMIITELGGANPFDHLDRLAKDIFMPILSNQKNQQKWGEIPTRELMDRFHNFVSSTTILCGQIKGETNLPLPQSTDSSGVTKNQMVLLEGAIITWTKQIRSVLKQDSESQLKSGLHPTPDVEIEFWKNKAANLNSIYEQLRGSRVRTILRNLDKLKSTYHATFSRLIQEVLDARAEANDNTKYLRTLEKWFNDLQDKDDFTQTTELFKPMLHIILLIWKNSKYYKTTPRLVVLMKEISNSIIKQATKYISGATIFQFIDSDETDKAVDMLKKALIVCGTFKGTYLEYRETANTECPHNKWNVQNSALFSRLDSFLERCSDILDLTQTIVQFSKLAKIEIGGTKGKAISDSIRVIHEDFQKTVGTFKQVPYDIMDVSAKDFDDHYYQFKNSMKDLERRLGAVICLSFDDCATVNGRFKLLDSFEGLLERPIIQDELEKKYISLVQATGQDLKTVQELFLYSKEKDSPPIPANMPPVAGALNWNRGLLDRIKIPMDKLALLDKTVLEREEAKEVKKLYDSLHSSIADYENTKVADWNGEVQNICENKLKQPLLLRREDNRMLSVNFDPQLIKLLREVKYLLLLQLPPNETAQNLYKMVDVYREFVGNLDSIVNINNEVLRVLLPVEKPLVLPSIQKFDVIIEKGLTSLNWTSNGIKEFISEAKAQIEEVQGLVNAMKDNINKVDGDLSLNNKPMLQRKPKPITKEEFEREFKAAMKDRITQIKAAHKNISDTVKGANQLLRVPNAASDWRSYVDFCNGVVVEVEHHPELLGDTVRAVGPTVIRGQGG